jgi:hypothetical protein
LRSTELLGVKNFVGQVSSIESRSSYLLPPPHFGEHTKEILLSLQ